jgi:uncharacterized protein YbjT (DUF2867 family)
MVGTEVLHQCLGSDQIERIVTIGRRSTGVDHPKLVEIEHRNFLDLSPVEAELSHADICFYCLGVYQNQVPPDAFWEITVDYLEELVGVLQKANQEIMFCLFSAQGADQTEKSPFRFAKAKGRAEKLLMDSRIRKKYIFRPGFINPGRKSAQTGWSGGSARLFYRLIPSIGIDAADLAEVMVFVGLNGSAKPILSNREMRNMARDLH